MDVVYACGSYGVLDPTCLLSLNHPGILNFRSNLNLVTGATGRVRCYSHSRFLKLIYPLTLLHPIPTLFSIQATGYFSLSPRGSEEYRIIRGIFRYEPPNHSMETTTLPQTQTQHRTSRSLHFSPFSPHMQWKRLRVTPARLPSATDGEKLGQTLRRATRTQQTVTTSPALKVT